MVILYACLVIQIFLLSFFFVKSEKQRISFSEQRKENKTLFNIDNIDVIIAAKESYERISLCINSVLESGFTNIYICVDGKNSNVVKLLKLNYHELNIFENNGNLGKTKSQIKCLEQAKNKDVLVLDADIILKTEEIMDFINYYYTSKCNFLCPYSNGKAVNENILFGIAESDRYMRQRIVRAGRDFYGVSNLSGYCMLCNRMKYLEIINVDTIQDDVIATINLFKKGFVVKTYHKSICIEEERNRFIPYLYQKTRWTAGNLALLGSYPKLFKSIPFVKALVFSSSFLLWYFALWVDFVCFCYSIFNFWIFIPLLVELIVKYLYLLKISGFKLFRVYNFIYVIIWPLFTTLCLLLTPLYLVGLIGENKTRRF
ncbi:membrane hypothetical protein [Treponema phagedenis]|uniref:Glycosyltransferase 2-like domain-containing protein n=1 Tax=Treponema phagedenis TaxID=162 RepID=A0A0B7GXS2_TREPH|nr:glycosyltransferase family 2 protein [Treponema phagedenis]QSH95225.1 hypothetical protein C5O78_09325 [Treponema phagedenis]CEM62392.1 membrane hypothetical protein [Treponema phagedenis]